MNLPLRKTTPKLNELTATGIVVAINAGQTTCEAVVRACLEHIPLREPHVQAWQ
jgi:Asp-tRNA(Asn)/Glu-tRNA(Gln) amidotransferase A subunit family amidase